jgi:ABC-type lipoprotein export system ATPase subunit
MALFLRQLKKQYVSPEGGAVPVIDVPAFDLAGGEQVALVGGSGTGKTTLLHLIAGILAPDGGQILFTEDGEGAAVAQRSAAAAARAGSLAGVGAGAGGAGRSSDNGAADAVIDYRAAPSDADQVSGVDITRLSEAERDVFRGRNIGYIFQTHHLLPGFTALENVLLGMSFTGRRHDPAWARHLLQEVGLSDRLDYKPGKLSVGQQQRVAVARALANRPKLVLADEPTGALDPKTAQQVLELIRRLCTEVAASLLLVSHDPQISNQFPRVVSLAELNRAAD